ncbi:hypothetical protein [Romboutsia weinsteinii]|uniref:hypothetical protein n=1 Tax=Romboutsia weinsteinii TaxID=2020949 RepID=UPI0011C03055|nr:hypothetical protein [Romboutsia weinsteinii]
MKTEDVASTNLGKARVEYHIWYKNLQIKLIYGIVVYKIVYIAETKSETDVLTLLFYEYYMNYN